jgi:lipid A 3-O-deacylase
MMLLKQMYGLAVAGVLALASGCGAFAQQAPFVREVKIGVLAHDIPDIWSGFRLERGTDLNVEVILSPALPLFGGFVRPAVGGSLNIGSHHGTSKAYLDARWEFEGSAGWFVGLGIGAALHNGLLDPVDPARKALGRRVLFHFPLEFGIRLDAHSSVSVYFDHMSNAYTKPSNEGLDTLGMRYGYKF